MKLKYEIKGKGDQIKYLDFSKNTLLLVGYHTFIIAIINSKKGEILDYISIHSKRIINIKIS